MAGTLQKVRFKVAWQGYRVGAVIMPNGTLRDWLIGNGYAEPVSGETETVTPPPVVARASQPPRRGQRRA